MKLDTSNAPDDYKAALKRLRKRMNKWRKANPTTPVTISFHIPDKVVIITTIRGALSLGLCRVNKDGWEMLKAMCEPEEAEPTISMVREAIEMEDK